MLKFHHILTLFFILTSCAQNSTNKVENSLQKQNSIKNAKLGDTTANVKELIIYNRTPQRMLKNLPQALTKFISKGYAALDTVCADLNTDGLSDILLATYQLGEDSINPSPKRNLKILLGQPDKAFKLACESWTILASLDMGGFSDPYPGIVASEGKFIVQFSGGSNWKRTNAMSFEYSSADKDWILIREINESYFMDKRYYQSDTLTKKQFGKATFKKKYCKVL